MRLMVLFFRCLEKSKPIPNFWSCFLDYNVIYLDFLMGQNCRTWSRSSFNFVRLKKCSSIAAKCWREKNNFHGCLGWIWYNWWNLRLMSESLVCMTSLCFSWNSKDFRGALDLEICGMGLMRSWYIFVNLYFNSFCCLLMPGLGWSLCSSNTWRPAEVEIPRDEFSGFSLWGCCHC